MAEQQNAQDQRCRLAGTGTGYHRRRRRVTENHLPLCSTGLSLLGQERCNIGLDLFFKLASQGQAPVIEQIVINAGRTQYLRASITDDQYLPALFQPFGAAFLKAVIHPGAVTAAKPVRLAL